MTCDGNCPVALCGNGFLDTAVGETCDDGNFDVCGSCGADCGTLRLAQATGVISVIDAARVASHETFTLDDGFHPRSVFEFIRATGTADTGHLPIVIDDGEDAGDLHLHLRSRINVEGGTLDITASIADIAGVPSVLLKNDHESSRGNVRLDDLGIADPGFHIAGMTGGLGADCPPSTGCVTNSDCFSGICRADKRCD